MKKVLTLKKTWYFILLSIAAFPLLPKGVESVLMIFFFIFSICLSLKEGNQLLKKEKLKKVVVLSSVFFIYSLSFLYSDNYKEGLKLIIISLPVLMFPLSIGFLVSEEISNKKIQTIKHIYIVSVFLSLLISHAYLLANLEIGVSDWSYRKNFEDYTKVHGTYFSLWIGFGVLIILNELFEIIKKTNYLHIIIYIFIISYFLYWQVVISARLPLFMTIFLGGFFIISNLKDKNKLIILIPVVLLSGLLISLKFDTIKSKIKFGIPEGKYELNHLNMTSEEIRTGIYYCSYSLIKESWFFGYGIGDVNDSLNLCYKEKIKSNVYQIFKYNSHNQYVQLFLSAGIIGFLFFIYNLYYVFKRSIKNRYVLYIVFNVLVLTCFLTENILSRHDGVLFYSYFNTLLFFKIKKD